MPEFTHQATNGDINSALKEIAEIAAADTNAEHALQKLRLSYLKEFARNKELFISQEYSNIAKRESEFLVKKIKQGHSIEKIKAANETATQLLLAKKEAVAEAKKKGLKGKALKEELKAIDEKYKKELEEAGDLVKERAKLDEKAHKEQISRAKKDYADSRKQGVSKAEIREKLKEEGLSDEDIAKAEKSAAAQAAVDAIGDFAKQLSGTIKDIAYTQTEIDTRLYGSKNDKTFLGSYWQKMSANIAGNVAMSPLVKQADVVSNLKNLVSQGIAYNVEQRAFLDTVSDKIATTFEATDATLLKLVRIQQADTTAARLGMEAALTAFLNNMYETTEYMTQAANNIRASIYEASALMGAAEATAFEYQVQKWMGSLHSVGFSNTEGLAGAFGKIAAGDISGLTDSGYGNLLVMAANRAGLSIADILQNGLTDAKTNILLEAMVEYLGDIYTETKNSRVVSQQFANVYGLTASDLKAAANLAKSTTTIANQNLNYGGMITQLNTMADSMYSRTSTGEMMENLWGNLQYTIAGGIGNNPVTYAIYNIASMLDSVAGGIAIPAFSVMGNMVDLETTVADLMRVGAVGSGLLSGIGKMIAGLGRGSGGGFSGSGMLKAFGVSSGISAVSRGNGEGLLTTATMDTSASGEYIGNEDSSDVQNKTMGDAQESGNKQLAEAQEETNETKLSTVDEHIMSIYNLLSDVVAGTSSLQVKIDGSNLGSSWNLGGVGNA